MDLTRVDLVEELHHDEDVEDDGVVFGGRRVQGCVTAAVDVKHLLSCQIHKQFSRVRGTKWKGLSDGDV